MVFVKRDEPAKPKAAKNNYMPEKKCMNCRTVLDSGVSGIYARRFCSQDCKDAYMGLK